MSVIHELLAVEQGLAETAKRLRVDTTKKLSGKVSLFTGLVKSHEPLREEDAHMKQATEYVEVQSTVDAQLDYLGTETARFWDATLQKEEANQRANADIVVDGITLAKDVPAIVLLSMEKRLTELLGTYNVIPTLDASVAWIPAENQGLGIFQTKHSIESFQTLTKKKYITVSPATDRHPAQMAQQDETTNIGKYTRTNFSGMLATQDKAERIQRLTALIRAVKQARQRANSTEVKDDLNGFGAALWNFVNNG